MNNIAKTLLATSVCLFTTLPVYAGHGHGQNRLLDRLDRQHERIEQGVKSGALTHKEVRVLKRKQRKIRHLAWHFREDGNLSKKERRILRRKLDRASDHIWELKHNDVYRYAHRNRHHEYAHHWDGDSAASIYRIDEDNEWPRYGFVHR
jgi:hypothetical protein